MTVVTALVPAFNEERHIADTVRALRKLEAVNRVLVIDDGSTDKTSALARQAGARVLKLKVNGGKGQALKKGLQAVDADVYVFADGDLGRSAQHVLDLLQPVLAGRADMTIGILPGAKKKGGVGLVKGLARFGIRHLTGLDLLSPLSGQRAVRRELLQAVGGVDPGWAVEVGLTIDAAWHGFRVMEVPVPMEHEETGRNLAGFYHRGCQFVHVLMALLRRWRPRARLQRLREG